MKNVLPTSYSSIDSYNTCPKRHYHTKVICDVVEPASEATIWGNEVHKALEERCRDGTPLTARMAQYEPIAAKIDKAPGDKFFEKKLAVNFDFGPTEFFADDVYIRGIEDVLIVNGSKAVNADHKTGKKKPKSRQLALGALRVFANFPDVQEVITVFNWLKYSPVEYTIAKYTRDQAPALWGPFIEDTNKMVWSYDNKVWPAKPSGLCKNWCPVTQCPHNGKYRR